MFMFYMQDTKYGELILCGTSASAPFCLVREFQDLGVKTEYDCPLLTLSSVLHIVYPYLVMTAVSLNHECTHTCTFNETQIQCTIERENVLKDCLLYSHDWQNHLFSLNIYCINQ